MNKNIFLGIFIGLFSMQIHAASFGAFDPRTLAMGSAGVASGDASNANFYNPALLSLTAEKDDFSLVVPSVVLGLNDPDNLSDALDAYTNADYESDLDAAIASYNSTGTLASPTSFVNSAANVANTSQDLLNSIKSLSDKALTLDMNIGVLLAVPSPSVGVSVGYSARTIGSGVLDITQADLDTFQAYIDVMTEIGNIDTTVPADATVEFAIIATNSDGRDPNNLIDDGTGQFTQPTTTLTSKVQARGAILTETSVSLAHQFPSLAGVSLGITPKSVEVTTFDYVIDINNSEITADEGQLKHSDFNFDIGAAMHLTDSIKAGFVAKNVISKSYKTALGNTIKHEPQYRAGLAYQNKFALVALDLDLSKNKGLDFQNDSQYAALGLEFDAFDVLKFRAGYRHNMVSGTGKAGLVSYGLGLNIVAVHLDIAVADNGNEQIVGVQLGVKF